MTTDFTDHIDYVGPDFLGHLLELFVIEAAKIGR
jgi:hypothetical protein